jgi:hypothetical protein
LTFGLVQGTRGAATQSAQGLAKVQADELLLKLLLELELLDELLLE